MAPSLCQCGAEPGVSFERISALNQTGSDHNDGLGSPSGRTRFILAGDDPQAPYFHSVYRAKEPSRLIQLSSLDGPRMPATAIYPRVARANSGSSGRCPPGLKKADMLIPLGVVFRAPNREVSMSTSLLYHAFGIRGYQYTRTQYQGGRIIFTIHQGPESCCCSSCGSARVIRRGQVVRQFRSLPIGGRATFVVLPIPRVECQTCGTVPGGGLLRRPTAELHLLL